MAARVVVIGSSNTDMVVQVARLPAPGETVLGGRFTLAAGGKGANQAVAAARLGAAVTFVACVGRDGFGEQALAGFRAEAIDVRFIRQDAAEPSGVALITVDASGENCIAVASGANAVLSPADVSAAAAAIREAGVVLLQLETPMATVSAAVAAARAAGVPVILNPAPAQSLPGELLRQVSVLTPNETEAQLLTGIAVGDEAGAVAAGRALRAQGVGTVILTLGARGAMVVMDGLEQRVDAPRVEAVDTTAAGDVFNGALAVALAEGRPMSDAVAWANRAAAISVTRLGAQPSAPRRQEVDGAARLPDV